MSTTIRIKSNFEGSSKILTVDKEAPLYELLKVLKENYPKLDTLIESNSVVIEHDYPKRKIDILESIEMSLANIGIKNGQQIWLSDPSGALAPSSSSTPAHQQPQKLQSVSSGGKGGDNASRQKREFLSDESRNPNSSTKGKVHTLSSLNKNKRPKSEQQQSQDKLVYTKSTAGGYTILRQMADDNSCLFHSISYCLFGDANHEISLRQIITEEILADPIKYNKAYLGKEISDYVTWISQENSWGGAIELEIFANHFGVEINSIDVKTGRTDTFRPLENNPNKNADSLNFIVIYYSGIHFDALIYNKTQVVSALSKSSGDTGTFVKGSSLGEEVLKDAEVIRKQLLKSGYVTDMGTIHVLCNQCNSILTGEKELVKHMKQTKHSDFQEVH